MKLVFILLNNYSSHFVKCHTLRGRYEKGKKTQMFHFQELHQQVAIATKRAKEVNYELYHRDAVRVQQSKLCEKVFIPP